RGDVDILRLDRDEAGELRALIADIKSSRSAKVEHRLQVAFYHEMLATTFDSAGIAATIETGILYRGSTDGVSPASPAEQRMLEEQAALATALFGVNGALPELVTNPENYRAEAADLLIGPDASATTIA